MFGRNARNGFDFPGRHEAVLLDAGRLPGTQFAAVKYFVDPDAGL